MEFLKIGKTGGVVEINYEGSENFVNTIKQRCEDSPLPSFDDALQALVGDVVEQCDLKPEDAFNASITVRYVTLKWNDDKGEGISITAVKSLGNGKSFTITTPQLYESDEKAPISKQCLMLIETVKEEAGKYVRGKRLQGKLEL